MPEVSKKRPPLYSFRDLVALRTVAWLRTNTSLQKVRRAFAQLGEFDLTDHPAAYEFAVGGGGIAVWTDAGFMDLVKNPGQYQFYTLADVFRPFNNRNDENDRGLPEATSDAFGRRKGNSVGGRLSTVLACRSTLWPMHCRATSRSAATRCRRSIPGESERGARRPRLCRACLLQAEGFVKFFLDENVSVGCLKPLEALYGEHEFRHAYKEGLGGTKDVPLLGMLSQQGYDAIITKRPDPTARRRRTPRDLRRGLR